MTYQFNYSTIVTIYTYIVYPLYIETLLFLLKGNYVVYFYIVQSLLKDIDYLTLAPRKALTLIINESIEHPQNLLFQLKGGEPS